jgi:hypothetical protein
MTNSSDNCDTLSADAPVNWVGEQSTGDVAYDGGEEE